MRQRKGAPVLRRLAALTVVIALAALLVAPATAWAAAAPRSTLRISTRTMVKPKSFTISGKVASKYKGKKMYIEIRKPGRDHWDQVKIATIGKSGRWSTTYTPKLGGKFYIRARYGATGKGLSRTSTLTVKRGSGKKTQVLLASTTSTRDSGLFELIGPAFMEACPEYTLKATFVGSGAAIALGGTGDADVLLVHSPAAEVDFMNGIVAGKPSAYKGKTRYKVMYNDFVVVGPTANPAGVVNSGSAGAASAAFKAISNTGSTFWSRADNSGTNEKEKEIWKSIGNPQTGQPWYKATKMSMAQALGAANGNSGSPGYTLADRATWLNANSLGIVPNLKIHNAGDPTLFNQYSVIEVNKARNVEGAQDFSNWIRSKKAQALINSYGQSTFPGQVYFTANAGSY